MHRTLGDIGVTMIADPDSSGNTQRKRCNGFVALTELYIK